MGADKAALWVGVVAIVVSILIPLGTQAATGHVPRWLWGSAAGLVLIGAAFAWLGTVGAPTPSNTAAPTTSVTTPSETTTTTKETALNVAPIPTSYPQRYTPVQLIVALGNCRDNPPDVDLSTPRTGGARSFYDFNYEACAGPPEVQLSPDVETATLRNGAVPSAETCIRAIDTGVTSKTTLSLHDGDVACMRRISAASVQVVSAIVVDDVREDSMVVTAYSWDLPE